MSLQEAVLARLDRDDDADPEDAVANLVMRVRRSVAASTIVVARDGARARIAVSGRRLNRIVFEEDNGTSEVVTLGPDASEADRLAAAVRLSGLLVVGVRIVDAPADDPTARRDGADPAIIAAVADPRDGTGARCAEPDPEPHASIPPTPAEEAK